MATLRQKKAIEKLAETGGNVTEAMRQAGYSEGTIQHPSILTKSKAFIELFHEVLPDEALAKRHTEFIYSEREEIGVKALDMAYKLKGSYAPDKTLNVNVDLTIDNEAIDNLANVLENHERELPELPPSL